MKKLIPFLLFFLILLVSVMGVKPVQTSVVSGELTILYPKLEYVPLNSYFNLHFHILNSSGYILPSPKVSCTIHVYNSTNHHTLKTTLTPDGVDQEYMLNKSFTSKIGILTYNLWCNSTEHEGGFVSDYVFITESGRQEDSMGSTLLGILILIPLLFGLFCLFGSATLGEDHTALRIFLFLLAPITIFVSLHFALLSIIKYYGMFELQEVIGSTAYWMGWVFFVLVSYFVIYSIWKMFDHMAQKKKERLKY